MLSPHDLIRFGAQALSLMLGVAGLFCLAASAEIFWRSGSVLPSVIDQGVIFTAIASAIVLYGPQPEKR